MSLRVIFSIYAIISKLWTRFFFSLKIITIVSILRFQNRTCSIWIFAFETFKPKYEKANNISEYNVELGGTQSALLTSPIPILHSLIQTSLIHFSDY